MLHASVDWHIQGVSALLSMETSPYLFLPQPNWSPVARAGSISFTWKEMHLTSSKLGSWLYFSPFLVILLLKLAYSFFTLLVFLAVSNSLNKIFISSLYDATVNNIKILPNVCQRETHIPKIWHFQFSTEIPHWNANTKDDLKALPVFFHKIETW